MPKNEALGARMGFALRGIGTALRAERSLRTQAAAFVVVVVVLAVLRPAPVWWALFALASFLVLSAELFNTAIERLADHLHPEIHPGIRAVKDCAAGAVLLASLGALAAAAAFAFELLRGA